jgi:LuxR family maltose regulon positive regulatory protein
MTGTGELLEALPRHETAHAALLTDVLDVVHGASLPANTHVRNIYAKLQARDRSSAVQRARELRLLSAGLTR